jgi:serine phosphatase RsbU (regulator of sigma subunit)
MIRIISKIITALFSNSALEEIYERRQRKVKGRNNRSVAAVLLVGGVLLGLMAFTGGMFFIERDSRSYLESRNRVTLLDGEEFLWQSAEKDACPQSEKECLPFNLSSVEGLSGTMLSSVRVKSQSSSERRFIRLRLSIPAQSWKGLSEFLTLTISLPNMKYNRAEVYLNREKQRSFFLSRPINFPFETKDKQGQALEVDVLLEATGSEPFALGVTQPAFISTQSEFEKFGEHLVMQRSGRGNWIAVVSRITLALFAIGLFLLIDSSSESLGLALFMGFEALGIAAKHGWLPLSALGPWWDIFTAALFTNMGMIFRVYFYINLARLAGVSLNRWIAGALLWSVPMAYYAMESGNKPESFYNLVYAVGTLVTAVFGIAVCLRSYIYIRQKALHWRHMALLSAAVAAVPALMLATDAIFPKFITGADMIDVVNTLSFNSGFVLALSAFFNISSLENRVKALSLVQLKAKQLEMELELARSVQKQHMRVPKVPDQISVECFQSAASYVSGDTYFFHWDEKNNLFTFLLNDVTGHGVQAALKATICNVIAELIWDQDSGYARSDVKEFRIARYNDLICKYLSERFQVEDLHSICGGEFLLETGELRLYRSNAPSPFILQPVSQTGSTEIKYEVLNVPLRNQLVSNVQLSPGAVVILMSDGILFSSREQANISRRLNELGSTLAGEDLSLEQVKTVITSIVQDTSKSIDDDKTLLMFRWQPRRVHLRRFKVAG